MPLSYEAPGRWPRNCEFFVLLVRRNEVNHKYEMKRRELEGKRSSLLCSTFCQLKITPENFQFQRTLDSVDV